MQHLRPEHHDMIDRAAVLLGPSTRGRLLLHVRARLADERALTISGLVNVLIRTLGDFGVSVGPAFFRHQQRSGTQRTFGRAAAHHRRDRRLRDRLRRARLAAGRSDGAKWPMIERTVHVPSWAISIADQDREARHGAAVVADIDKHRSRPKKHTKPSRRAERNGTKVPPNYSKGERRRAVTLRAWRQRLVGRR
jgi:hypothetical protein